MNERITSAEYRKRMGLDYSAPNGGDKSPKAQIRMPKKRTPNKTEAEWMRICETRHPQAIAIKYEPWSLKLEHSRTKYTPDVVVFEAFKHAIVVTCYEVKGPHLHGNSANSIRAFKEARGEFYMFNFIFAQRTKAGWATVPNATSQAQSAPTPNQH